MKRQTIVVIYYGDDWSRKIPFTSAATRASFELWHTEGQKRGFDVYRASIQWYDPKKNVFLKSWAYREGQWKKVSKPVKADMVFDKTTSKRDHDLHEVKQHIQQKSTILNVPSFRTILNNKLTQYMLFQEFMPQSILVSKKTELIKAIKKIKTAQVVAKPLYGVGGQDIRIEKKKDIVRKRLSYPLLLQEFIDGKKGIPNQKQKGLADLRIVYINHKPLFALSRIAKENSLFTNLHQGASATMVKLSDIPRPVHTVSKKIIQRLSVFPHCHYSLDFLFGKNHKPYLMEMNTTPGFDLLNILESKDLEIKNMEKIFSATSQ